MKRLYSLVGACASGALFAACGGSSGFSSSTPVSVTPQTAPLLAAPGAGLPASLRSQPAYGRYASHRVKRNVQKESVLYSFAGGSDGEYPVAALTNVGGRLYGTTKAGGTGSGSVCSSGCGTVFKITTSGMESVLHSFGGGSDGLEPVASLSNLGGTLYGTTAYGGASGDGTVFAITTSGTETALHSFGGGSDGVEPIASLTNVGGTLYGTTYMGGASGDGTVFKITTSGTETVLYSFVGGSDGKWPDARLTNVGGTLYGTTKNGGASNLGTVFKITTSGKESVLHSFGLGSDGV